METLYDTYVSAQYYWCRYEQRRGWTGLTWSLTYG